MSKIIFLNFFFTLILSCNSSSNAFVKHFEIEKDSPFMSISIPLMKALKIRQGIMIEGTNNKIKITDNFKKFSSNFIPIVCKTMKEVYGYIVNDSFPEVNTAIIFKEENILNGIWILKKLEEVS